MTLTKIEISNVKGIGFKSFQLNIIPNKPSLLVAPNGFGKSSFSTAFKSLNRNRINLVEEDYYQKNTSNLPKLEIDYQNSGTISNCYADNSNNSIKEYFDCFVINNQVKAKATKQNLGSFTSVKASMEVEPIILVESVPNNIPFSYSISQLRKSFGRNGKVLPNIEQILSNPRIICGLIELETNIERCTKPRIQAKIASINDKINSLNGTSQEICHEADVKFISEIEQINYLPDIVGLINSYDTSNKSKCEDFLTAFQVIELYRNNSTNFCQAARYIEYLEVKKDMIQAFKAFNATWKNIIPKQTGGQLIVEFPDPRDISNGQRDVLCFFSLLQKAKAKLKKDNCILIIDEVFDYLDDANLVAVQYYVTQLIEAFHSEGRKIYPLILTHINPLYFKNFVFSKQKVYFLDVRSATVNQQLIKLIENREEASIEIPVSKFLFHYHTDKINARAEFKNLGLKETWGEGDNFSNYIDSELNYYLNGQNYDPFAVCCAVRIKVEQKAYDLISNRTSKDEFLDKRMTKKKLMYAESIGVDIPEYFYLLGIVYNEGMHWKNNIDNVSPIVAKLDNLTIKSLIKNVTQ